MTTETKPTTPSLGERFLATLTFGRVSRRKFEQPLPDSHLPFEGRLRIAAGLNSLSQTVFMQEETKIIFEEARSLGEEIGNQVAIPIGIEELRSNLKPDLRWQLVEQFEALKNQGKDPQVMLTIAVSKGKSGEGNVTRTNISVEIVVNKQSEVIGARPVTVLGISSHSVLWRDPLFNRLDHSVEMGPGGPLVAAQTGIKSSIVAHDLLRLAHNVVSRRQPPAQAAA